MDKHKPGDIVYADWSGGNNRRMRLISKHDHPAGAYWAVNIYNPHDKRFSKTVQYVEAEQIDRATTQSTTTTGVFS